MTRIGAVRARLRAARARGAAGTLRRLAYATRSAPQTIRPRTVWGSRVGIRSTRGPLTDAEIEQVFGFAADADVLRLTGGTMANLTLPQLRAQLRKDRWAPVPDKILYYIVTRDEGIVGRVGLFSVDWAARAGEFGISIDKKHWKRHYGTEATQLAVRRIFATTPVRRIHAGTFGHNVGAQRTAALVGFRVTGSTTRFDPSQGRDVPSVLIEITPDDLTG